MIDVLALVEEGLRAKPPRGDEAQPHMSDNICDRQTWYRRSGEEALPHDFRTLVKFELGHQFERGVADVLEKQLESRYEVTRDVLVEWRGLIGHGDFAARSSADNFLLEIKSTSFLRGKVPEEPATWYVEQAAMYAAGLNISRFGILVGCRESGKIAPIFWFSLDDQYFDYEYTWREWAVMRADTIVAATDPDSFPPDADPRTSWACKTCPYTVCVNNKNPAAPAAHTIEDKMYA